MSLGTHMFTGWPEAGLWASEDELRAGKKALMLHLDPVSLVVSVPSLPGDDVTLARFCRELARNARQLAIEFDSDEALAGGG